VIIIGGGGAGITAAVSAAQNGATVISIEKSMASGGNTIRAGGKMNAVVPKTQRVHTMTASQMAEIKRLAALPPRGERMAQWQIILKNQIADYEKSGAGYLFDSEELHMIQTYVDGDYYGNPVLIESLCRNAPITFRWMEDLGYEWNSESQIVVGALWPRSQFGWKYTSGAGFIEIYTDHIKKNNYPVEFITEVKAEEIIITNGRATGVRASASDGTPYEFKANRGVVLATGGFSANVEMRVKYNTIWPYVGERLPTTNWGSFLTLTLIAAQHSCNSRIIELTSSGDEVSCG
jgi:succinate dehydrogenase/fumarate reductase flavoprotein subunit